MSDISSYYSTTAQVAVTVVTFYGAYIGRLQSTYDKISSLKNDIIVDYITFREQTAKISEKQFFYKEFLISHGEEIEKIAKTTAPRHNKFLKVE
jgi:hypothetical protein